MKNMHTKIMGGLLAGFLATGSLFAQVPANDLCANAAGISCGQTVSGSTTNATNDAGLITCGVTSNTSKSVWYKFSATTTGTHTLTTCASVGFDTRIRVYTGSCGAFSCVGGNDDAACTFSSLRSTLNFTATSGTTYYILVDGFGSSSGAFNLSLACPAPPPPPPANDLCANAATISCGQSVNGTTASATLDAVATCGTSVTAPGVWYRFTGNGDIVTLSTCAAGSYDTKLSVYSGACGALTCVNGNDDFCGLRSQVTFISDPGVNYYVLVHGFGSATGTFTLSASCVTPAPNDRCSGAIAVGCGQTVSGSTVNASFDNVGTCGTSNTTNGVWYRVSTVAGSYVTATTCGAGTNFDTKLSVFDGSCGSLICVGGNDDMGAACAQSGLRSSVSWCADGGDYLILVHGYNTAVGNFDLSVNCSRPLTVDAGDCQTNYDGYGDALNYLVATASGGAAPYTYSWTPSGVGTSTDGSGLAVDPATTTTYTVTVTDANGCTASDNVTVQVIDVSCGRGKVNVCHVPPGNPGMAHNICISENAVPAHIANHGDYIGPCDNPCRATNDAFELCTPLVITLTTDRFPSETSWELVNTSTGAVVDSRLRSSLTGSTTYEFRYCVDADDCYEFRIHDSFGDGICCAFGAGNYSVSFNGNTVNSPSGGAFGSNETVTVGSCGASSNKAVVSPVAEPTTWINAYPNPFSQQATLEFAVSEGGHAVVEVFDMAGSRVAQVFAGETVAGEMNKVTLNANGLANGLYIYRLTTAQGESFTGKISLNR